MNILYIAFLSYILIDLSREEVEVSSDAAAAVKQQTNGQKQTFISSQSRAKTGQELLDEERKFKELNQRSGGSSLASADNTELQWGYTDSSTTYSQYYWSKYYPICNASKQSPIALQADSNQISENTMSSLKLQSKDKDATMYGQLVNDGRSFGIKMDEQRTNINITGGPLLNNVFQLYQFHFHFSCDFSSVGSEHSMDGQKSASELHLVFYNKKYSSFDIAKDKSDGLAVLGVLIKYGSAFNFVTYAINRYLIDIIEPDSSIPINYGMSLFDLVPKMRSGIDKMNYATYEGSLTTPPCYESVHWIVFREPLKIPARDIESWRKLKGHGTKLCNNFRHIQPSNGRPIYVVNPSESN